MILLSATPINNDVYDLASQTAAQQTREETAGKNV